MFENPLPYTFCDADNHYREPDDVFERFIDPSKDHLAIRGVEQDGRVQMSFAGRPSKFGGSEQITFSDEQVADMIGAEADAERRRGGAIPGSLLNRLNPLKGVSDQERQDLVALLRQQGDMCGDRNLRLSLMDDQGIEAAICFPARAHAVEYEFIDNVDAIYANVRAFNRWIYEEVGFATENRMFVPPYLPLADPEASLAELEILIDQGAPVLQMRAGFAHGGRDNLFGGRSPADPVFDPIWSRINEAGIRMSVHQGGTDYPKYGTDWSYQREAEFGKFDAFQYVSYWSDRPAMDFVSGLILHNFFGRFPNIRFVMAEQGSVWVPYIVRKCDHAFFMGRKSRFGDLNERPSSIFKRHFLVAPYPEENVNRLISAVGTDPVVFGSDFPHGEGLAFPGQYAVTQLDGLPDDQVKKIMRDNLADFLGLAA